MSPLVIGLALVAVMVAASALTAALARALRTFDVLADPEDPTPADPLEES